MELRALVDLGIECGQGFLLGRPMAAAMPAPPLVVPRAAVLPASS